MNQTRAQVMEALSSVAPEFDQRALDAARPLREQLDLDSMGFVRFVTELSKLSGADIPERDYPRLSTLESCERYLGETTLRRSAEP